MIESFEQGVATLQKKRRTLIFLIVLLSLILAASVAFVVANPGQSAFDSKGILTGAGSFFGLMGAAQLALIFLLGLRLCFAHSTLRTIREASRVEGPAFSAWLSMDVLGASEPAAPGWSELRGAYRGHPIRVESKNDRLVVSTSVKSALAFKLSIANGQNTTASKSEFSTNSAVFDRWFDWQSPAPREACDFFKRPGVADAFLRLIDLQAKGLSAACENGALSISVPKSDWDGLKDHIVCPLIRGIGFLADDLEGKSHPPTRKNSPEVEQEQAPKRDAVASFFATNFMLVATVFTLAALLWVGGSYFVASRGGMAAGMACFFMPLLAFAFFVFTRPVDHGPDWRAFESERFERFIDDEESEALEQSYVKRRKQFE